MATNPVQFSAEKLSATKVALTSTKNNLEKLVLECRLYLYEDTMCMRTQCLLYGIQLSRYDWVALK